MATRVQEALLGEGVAFGRGKSHRMLDPRFGGQGAAYAPLYGEWVSSALHRRQNLVGVLLQPPRAFELVPDGDRWTGMLKAIVERHALTYEGLNGTVTLSVDANPVGGGGQQMNEVLNSVEEQSNVVMTFMDRDGMTIANFWREFITMFIMDPHSKMPNFATMPGAQQATDWLPDMYTFSMAFFEPNHLFNQVVNAWVVADMFPQSSGEILGSMDRQSQLNTVPLNITMGGLAQFGDGPRRFCRDIQKTMSITGAAPTSRESFIKEINAGVLKAEYGYQYSMETVGREAVNR